MVVEMIKELMHDPIFFTEKVGNGDETLVMNSEISYLFTMIVCLVERRKLE